MKNYSVLFVCLGNICRSPTAHGVFRHLISGHGLSGAVTVDSAGTSNYHFEMELVVAIGTGGMPLGGCGSRGFLRSARSMPCTALRCEGFGGFGMFAG